MSTLERRSETAGSLLVGIKEIAQLLAGHPDVEGLCRALADWSAGCA